jgi:hypothetical protein
MWSKFIDDVREVTRKEEVVEMWAVPRKVRFR